MTRSGAWLIVLGVLAAGCRTAADDPTIRAIGDPELGRQVIRDAGCGACHTIPGVRGARGMVGPPLTNFAHRTFIAGAAPNTPDTLVRWVRDPRAIEPHTAMPDLGLDDRQARAVAAYLYTLR